MQLDLPECHKANYIKDGHIGFVVHLPTTAHWPFQLSALHYQYMAYVML